MSTTQLVIKWSRRHFKALADCKLSEHPNNTNALLAEWTSLIRQSGVATDPPLELKPNTHYQLELLATASQALALFVDLRYASNDQCHLLPLLPVQCSTNSQLHLWDFSTSSQPHKVSLCVFQRQGWSSIDQTKPILLIEEARIIELGPSPISSLWVDSRATANTNRSIISIHPDDNDQLDDDGMSYAASEYTRATSRTHQTSRTSQTSQTSRTSQTNRTSRTSQTSRLPSRLPEFCDTNQLRRGFNTSQKLRRYMHVLTGKIGNIAKQIMYRQVALSTLKTTKYSLQRFDQQQGMIDSSQNTSTNLPDDCLCYPEIVQAILLTNITNKPHPGTTNQTAAFVWPSTSWPDFHILRIQGHIEQQMSISPKVTLFPAQMRPIYRHLIANYLHNSLRQIPFQTLPGTTTQSSSQTPGVWSLEAIYALINGFGFVQRDRQTFWTIRDFKGDLHNFVTDQPWGSSDLAGSNTHRTYPIKFQPLINQWHEIKNLGTNLPDNWTLIPTDTLTSWVQIQAGLTGLCCIDNQIVIRQTNQQGEIELWQASLSNSNQQQ